MSAYSGNQHEFQVGDVVVETGWDRVTSAGIGATCNQRFRFELTSVKRGGAAVTVSKKIARDVRKKGAFAVMSELLRPWGLTLRASTIGHGRIPYGRRGWIVERYVTNWVVITL